MAAQFLPGQGTTKAPYKAGLVHDLTETYSHREQMFQHLIYTTLKLTSPVSHEAARERKERKKERKKTNKAFIKSQL